MRSLSESKLESIVTNYLNGNISTAKAELLKLNKLQCVQFVNRASNYGLLRHQAYTLIVLTLTEQVGIKHA